MRAELLIRKRIWKLMVVLTALFGAIVARIISLTVIQGEALTARGVRQWTQVARWRHGAAALWIAMGKRWH